jgi:hypothetical protein
MAMKRTDKEIREHVKEQFGHLPKSQQRRTGRFGHLVLQARRGMTP